MRDHGKAFIRASRGWISRAVSDPCRLRSTALHYSGRAGRGSIDSASGQPGWSDRSDDGSLSVSVAEVETIER